MKKFRKIMAVLVAAMMIMATMVPAFASSNADTGRLDDHTSGSHIGSDMGTIKIRNVKAGEDYTVWRMFELASFDDKNNLPAQHSANPNVEAYSYVIDDQSPWYAWLLGYDSGEYGTGTQAGPNARYANFVPSTGTPSAGTEQLFWIEPATVTIDGNDNYHIIYATDKFTNSADLPTSYTDSAAQTADYFRTADATVVQKFAQAAVAWAETKDSDLKAADFGPVFGAYTATASDTEIIPGTSTYTLNKMSDNTTSYDLRLGYYLIGTTQGTLCSLDTTNRVVTMYDKNQSPTLDSKKVLDKGKTFTATTIAAPGGVDTNWVDNRDARVGETVYFRTQFTAMQGMENYVLHDVMEPGLGFDNSTTGKKIELITLTRGTGDDAETTEIKASVTVDTTTKKNWECKVGQADGCDFEIVFEPEKFYYVNSGALSELIVQDNDVINVYYSALLTTDAVYYSDDTAPDAADDELSEIETYDGNDITSSSVIPKVTKQVSTLSDGDGRNTNWTILTYGENSVTPAFLEATVTTYRFDIVKTNTLHNLLKDAEFTLYEVSDTATATSYTFGKDAEENIITKYQGDAVYFTMSTNTYTYDISEAGTTTLTSSDTAEIELKGLDAGEYLLVENKEPTGYHKLAYPIWITINGGVATRTPAPANEGKITVVSKGNDDKVSTASTKTWDAETGENDSTGLYEYDTATGGLEIENFTSQELPSTGGMGTTVLYIVGGMMVILAGAYLFFSRRRQA